MTRQDDTGTEREERTDAEGRLDGSLGDGGVSRRAVLAGALAVGAGAAGVSALSTPGTAGDGGNGKAKDGEGNGSSAGGGAPTAFTVRVENVSTPTTLRTTAMEDLAEQAVPLSPGAFAVHTAPAPIFTAGEPERDNGLEEIAEDGMPGRLVESLANREGVAAAGAFTTPVGASEPAPIGPGGAYEFDVEARPGHRLSFVTMFVPSNDLFYGPDERGIPLFEGGAPVEGDVTDAVGLWDAGTEINEEPGVGENQVQRQRGAGVGLVERGTVAAIRDVNGYDYPPVADVVRVTVRP